MPKDLARHVHKAGALPAQEISVDVLQEKYARADERSIEDVQRRVAHALAQYEAPAVRDAMESRFLWAMAHGFVAGGRINSAAGAGIKATLMNCYVQPIGDSITGRENDVPGIYTALAEGAETLRRGGGVGYDFSPIRPYGSLVRGTLSTASGPVSYMEVFDASCRTVESAGARRGAQMGVLRIDHPDIERFIHAKDSGKFSNFNLSVAVTDAFMVALQNGASVDLVHDAQPGPAHYPRAYERDDGLWVYRSVKAATLWEQIMGSTYDHAEPGVLFIDRINAENNLAYAETLAATNPCAEQPLPAYGCCDLGSVNLTRFVRAPFTGQAKFDFAQFGEVVKVGVRMLDLAIDANDWPLPQQREEGLAKRRIGLGFLGLGSALVMLGLRYDSQAGRDMAASIAEALCHAAYTASVDLAMEKGPFPLYQEHYLDSPFIQRLPSELVARIGQHGIRNSHLVSIAPTGTIALAFADNASNGIEPVYAWQYQRRKRQSDDTIRVYDVADHAWRLYQQDHGGPGAALPDCFVTALEMSADDHVAMLAAVQPYVDTSISKTVNVARDYPFDRFKDLYQKAWKAGLKGLTTYRPNDVVGSVLSAGAETREGQSMAAPASGLAEPAGTLAAPAAGDDDPLRRQFDSRQAGELESVTSKVQYVTQDGRRTMYLSISFIQVEGRVGGRVLRIERPFEFFMPANQCTDGHQWITSTMRLLSMAARAGGSIAKALSDMREVVWEKGPVRCGTVRRADGVEVPLHHDSEVAALAYTLQCMLIRRGYLDQEGRQRPLDELAEQLARRGVGMDGHAGMAPALSATVPALPSGQRCAECGARQLIRVDGCVRCLNCHAIGSCG